MTDHNDGTNAAASRAGAAGFLSGDDGLAAMTEMGRNNAEAMLRTAKPVGRAAETLARETNDYVRKSGDDGFAILRTLTEARTPADLARIQLQLTRAALDNAAAFSDRVNAAVRSLSSEMGSDGSLGSTKSDIGSTKSDIDPGSKPAA